MRQSQSSNNQASAQSTNRAEASVVQSFMSQAQEREAVEVARTALEKHSTYKDVRRRHVYRTASFPPALLAKTTRFSILLNVSPGQKHSLPAASQEGLGVAIDSASSNTAMLSCRWLPTSNVSLIGGTHPAVEPWMGCISALLAMTLLLQFPTQPAPSFCSRWVAFALYI